MHGPKAFQTFFLLAQAMSFSANMLNRSAFQHWMAQSCWFQGLFNPFATRSYPRRAPDGDTRRPPERLAAIKAGLLMPRHTFPHNTRFITCIGTTHKFGNNRALNGVSQCCDGAQICRCMESLCSDLEAAAYPALDALSARVTSPNLERVRRIKSRLTRYTTRVETIREVLEKFLDDDDDMHDMNLTAKEQASSTPSLEVSQPETAAASSSCACSPRLVKPIRSAARPAAWRSARPRLQLAATVMLATLRVAACKPNQCSSTASQEVRSFVAVVK